MILDGDKPPIIYWQSLETKDCYEEPPFGSYKTVHLDDIVLLRMPKPAMSPARPLKADIRRAEKKAARIASKNAMAEAKKGRGEKNGHKRREFREWQSIVGSFMLKSSKNLVEV
jgi:hypothetical protein